MSPTWVRGPGYASDGLAIWREHGPTLDVVICDVAMADMRGPELVERMAAHGPVPRVLFITGYSEEATRAALSHPVLAKPVLMDVLLQAVSDRARA